MFKKNQAGISVIEILLAISIFLVVFLAVSYLLIDNLNNSFDNNERVSAEFMVQEGLEVVRAISENSWDDAPAGTYGLVLENGEWRLAMANESVSQLYKDGQRMITITDINENLKKVESFVVWQSLINQSRFSQATTFISNWPELAFGECVDGIDNDGDGLIDVFDDPGCYAEEDPNEFGTCEDNDMDGYFSPGEECLPLVDVDESGNIIACDGELNLEVITSQITYGAGGPEVFVKLGLWQDTNFIWLFNQEDVDGQESYLISTSQDTKIALRGQAWYSNVFNRYYDSNSGSPHVAVLMAGDDLPNVPAFGGQTPLPEVLASFVDQDNKIDIDVTQVLVLWEFADLNSVAADFQDLVVLLSFVPDQLDFCDCGPFDCDDTNAEINPGQAEIPNNLIDENCDFSLDDPANDPEDEPEVPDNPDDPDIEIDDIIETDDEVTIVINACNNYKWALSHIAVSLPSGAVPIGLKNNDIYNTAKFSYSIEFPTNNPFYAIKFETIGEGPKKGECDKFEITLTQEDYQRLTEIQVEFKTAKEAPIITLDLDN